MSDPQSYGDPVDEPKDERHDVVGRAHEGLADAEAARRDAVDPEAAAAAWDERTAAEQGGAERAASDRDVVSDRDAAAPVVHDASPREPDATTARSATVDLDDEDSRWAAYAASADADTTDAHRSDAYAADTARADVRDDRDIPAAHDGVQGAGYATAGAAGAAAAGAAGAAAADDRYSFSPSDADTQRYATEPARAGGAPQPIFVQAPEAPRPRGNRGAAGAIGLLAALVFAVLYLAAILGLALLTGDIDFAGVPQAALEALTTWGLWIPTLAFFVGFWFLGALINRGRWGHWVVWGLVVGVVAWAGHLLGALFAAPFWMITARQGFDLLQENVLAPLAIVAFVLGRELTIWFGAWVSARGRRVTEINDEAQREYERTLEAGPQLAHR